ncbi:MAG: single-stranded DNA-binding protein [Vulcanimicrobiaceae bacterium]
MINFSDTGRIGRDAVTREAGGKPVTNFALAVDSGYGDRKQTLWFDCSAWGERYTKLAPYLLKGSQVQVAGELGTREHEGNTYFTLRVADVRLVGQKPETTAAPKPKPAPVKAPATDGFEDDDIPY